MIMNKKWNWHWRRQSRKTCSLKPDGLIKESHGQIFLANPTFVGWVSLAAYLNMKLMNFRWLDWLCCLRCECVVRPAALHSRRRAGLVLSVCPSHRALLHLLHHQQKYVHKAEEGDGQAPYERVSAPGRVLKARAAAAGRGVCWHIGHGKATDGQPAPVWNLTREEAMPNKSSL